MMRHSFIRSLALAAALLTAAAALGSEMVGVRGSQVQYPTVVELPFDGKPVRLSLTGTAMRTKAIVNVYAVASYVREGVKVRTAEELASADTYKVLHLVLERDVAGKDLAEAFIAAVRKNYPSQFADELRRFESLLGGRALRKGQHVKLTWLPKAGLRCEVVGSVDQRVDNPAFARAVWDIYFGKHHLGDAVKNGLTSRL
jgi:hypothetical protein